MNGSVSQAIRTWRVRPFEYGKSDCCAFVDHVVSALTGRSYLPEYVDHEALIEQHGSLSEAVTHYMQREPTNDLKPGDVVLVEILDHQSLGILVDDCHVVAMFQDGLPRYLSRMYVEHGWSLE